MERTFSEKDREFMRRAIALAANGEGRVSPNPPVGCVLVKDGRIVAEGWHDRLGDLHAEAMALREAGGAARGATAYVTLSPCTSHGRQPPCADALLNAGVAEVVVAARDPNPANRSGVEVVAAAGVPAHAGCLGDEAEYLARGFFKVQRLGLPHITFKYAMTLDGKIAAHSGDSRWISCEASRAVVMDMRSRSDAILVGSGTALADNPQLTVRDPVWTERGGDGRHRQPLRVVVDGALRTPESAALFSASGRGGPVLIACGAGASSLRMDALRRAGAEVVVYPGKSGRVDLTALARDLARRGVNMILCEGGGGLGWALLRQGLVDETVAFIAPKLVGGLAAPGPVGGKGLARMADAWPVAVREVRRIEGDVMLRGDVVYAAR